MLILISVIMIHGNTILTDEEKYSLISKNSAEGIIIIDESGTIEEWNGFMESRTHYLKSETYGRKIWDIQYNLLTKDYKNKYTLEALQKIWVNFITGLKDNEVIAKEGQFISKNKKVVLTEDIICQTKLHGKTYLYVIQRNRTEQKNADHKDVLISIITGELRSLITHIIDFSKFFNNKDNKLELDKVSNVVKQALLTSDNSIKLLANYSVWVKNQTGNISFNPKSNSLNTIIKEVFEEHDLLASKKNIRLNFIPVQNINCYADEFMLKTILTNLVHNSIKFNNPGGKTDIDATIQKDKIKISVSDNGIGFQNAKRNKLFIEESESKGEGSYGFGLLLIKDFVEKHKGKIWYNTMPGKGSTFFFTIPNEPPRF